MAEIKSKALPAFTEKQIARLWKHLDCSGGPDACWLWQGTLSAGYGTLSIDPGRTRVQAHRMAYFLGHGVDPAPLFVLHRCDEKRCCNPAHLWLGTAADNLHDCLAKGRFSNGDKHYWRQHPERVMRGENHPWKKHPELIRRGEKHAGAKLTESEVIEIRALYAGGEWTQAALAAKFGVVRATIGSVVNRKNWPHVA